MKNGILHSVVNDEIRSVGGRISIDDEDTIAIGSGIVICWGVFYRFVSSNTVSNEHVPFTIQGIRSGETVVVDNIYNKQDWVVDHLQWYRLIVVFVQESIEVVWVAFALSSLERVLKVLAEAVVPRQTIVVSMNGNLVLEDV